eukprot:m.6468 g.6468  ORF g.6468 m.6468 type:complete len:221 (+) comp3535_c0_seq2:142-804(+)
MHPTIWQLIFVTLIQTVNSDWLAERVAFVTKQVREQHNKSWNIVEVDACRLDPAVHVAPGGCMAQEPMSQIEDVGFIHVVYTTATASHSVCGPVVDAVYNLTTNKTVFKSEPFVMDDQCFPIGIENSSRVTISEAFQLAQSKADLSTFKTINYREVLYPCVSESTVIFTTDDTKIDYGSVFVGSSSRNVCKSAVTRPYKLPNGSEPTICTEPDHAPQCFK